MSRTIVRHSCAAALAALVAYSAGSPASSATRVTDVRVGEHPGATRVVLDVSNPDQVNFDVSPDGRTINVIMPGVDWRATPFTPHRHAKGVLRDFQYSAGRLTLKTREPVSVKSLNVGPEGAQGHRIVLDMTTGAAAVAAAKRAAPTAPITPTRAEAAPTSGVDMMVAGPANIVPALQAGGQAMVLTPGQAARPIEASQAQAPRAQQQPIPSMAQATPAPAPASPIAQSMLYLKGGAGVSIMEDLNGSTSTATITGETDIGYALSAATGYQISPMFRVEGELLYLSNDASSLSVTASGGSASSTAGGDVGVMAFMGNVGFDFPNETVFTPFVFGGLGYAEVSLNDIRAFGATLDSDSEWNFAWQLGAGASMDLDERFVLEASYRYFHTEFESADVESHLLMLAARYKF